MASPITEEGIAFATEFIEFMNESCSAFHAVEASRNRLIAAGFTYLSESEEWLLEKGGKYFFTRGGTTIIAFTVGGGYEPGNGFTIAGAHTDSPCLKIKPVTCITKSDALMLNTQPYGGGLWHTWFDRDLGIAGRVILRKEPSSATDDSFEMSLVRIDEPIARIPNLAIHLTAGSERESFAPNLHEHAKAILTMDSSKASTTVDGSSNTSRLHPLVLTLVAEKLGVDAAQIEDLELQLIDIQPSTLGGAGKELLFSGRLDNLCSSYQCLRALIDASSEESFASSPNIQMAMLFDHEEVGSSSCTGAGSSMLMDTLGLINASLADGSHGVLMRSLRKSFVASIDMAHALHPNYTGKHDSSTAPKINSGLVIKHNANQRYATTSLSATLFREFGKLAQVPTQEFSVRSDMGCGSTIGPIISTLTGIMTVDVGTPQFSMHSIRETMGSQDVHTGYAHIKSMFINHPKLKASTA